jgi:hypothetical protein
MRRSTHSSPRLGLLLVGALLAAPAARAQEAAPAAAPVEEAITQCGGKPVGEGEGQLKPLGHGFYADGERVRRGCTLLVQPPLPGRSPQPFASDTFQPLGCGFVRHASGIYWGRALGESERLSTPEPAEVLSRLDLADAPTFGVDADCRPYDARFFFLNHTGKPPLPAFVGVPRGEGQGYEELGCGYVRLGGQVFFGAERVEGAPHAPSFVSVQGRLPYADCGEGFYGKDRTRVWWRRELVRGARARPFRVPHENNPGLRVGCVGARSFQGTQADKKPSPVCRAVKKKPERSVKKGKR